MQSGKKGIPLLLLLGAGFLALGAKSLSRFILPVKGKIASGFGDRINPITKVKEFHNGIDITVPEGTPVLAPQDGEVINVYKTDVGGNQIVLRHPDGYVSGYAHLSKSLVKIGENVSQGQIIALSGRTGQVTGAHLHFSLRHFSLRYPKGKYIDPQSVLSFS